MPAYNDKRAKKYQRSTKLHANFRTTDCSNRWPIRNSHALNSAVNWFPPTVAANSVTEICSYTIIFINIAILHTV